MKIAIPMSGEELSAHFGHCDKFALLEVEGKEIARQTLAVPPPHEPGLLPKWLKEQGVTLVIAGGMGQRAQSLFSENGIEVVCGAPAAPHSKAPSGTEKQSCPAVVPTC